VTLPTSAHTHTLPARVAAATALPPQRVAAAIALFDAGNTLPFIARYRKEATGGLDEVQLRAIEEGLARLRALDERRAAVVSAIEAQGAMTPELRALLDGAETRAALEDLYAPYKAKRRTRAQVARERGLGPLADLIRRQPRGGPTPRALAARFVTADVPAPDDALAGARDIVAEAIADHAGVRQAVREKALRWALVRAERKAGADDPRDVYAGYGDFEARAERLQHHQVLAINRGEAQGVLRVGVSVPERDWRTAVAAHFRPDIASPLAGQLEEAIEDAARRLLLPAIGRDVRRTLTERAEAHAIDVFAANLRARLLEPPLAGHVVMGIDPAFRTGCKVAVVDPTGRLVAPPRVIYPHPPQARWDEAKAVLAEMVRRQGVRAIAIGNGTASRETERLVAEVVQGLDEAGAGHSAAGSPLSGPALGGDVASDTATPSVGYLVVNEAGASVYSASVLAGAELPDLDVSERGAVSIARRVQDPLAELVKIDPKAIGVGLYQHDVDQKALAGMLDHVVESVVNRVGVNVNTASPALLARVAGIGPKLAERIVATRDQAGAFATRRRVLDVPGLGARAFEQAAGFLRVHGGSEPLDQSAIHPESYPVARAVMARAGVDLARPPEARAAALGALAAAAPLPELAQALGTGEPTLADILEQLVRPGRDPRADAPPPRLRSDVLSMADLVVGIVLSGTVRNVVDFGAFVDIGVGQDGLVHSSRVPRGRRLVVGEAVDVEVLSIEPERGRIGLGLAEATIPPSPSTPSVARATR